MELILILLSPSRLLSLSKLVGYVVLLNSYDIGFVYTFVPFRCVNLILKTTEHDRVLLRDAARCGRDCGLYLTYYVRQEL